MQVIYQGTETETDAGDLAGFLRERNLNSTELVIEFNGEILTGNAAPLPGLNPGDRIDIFRIVTGG